MLRIQSISEIAQNTGNGMMLERMSALEKKMEDKNSEMMKMVQFINTRVSEYPPVHNSGIIHPMQVQLHLDLSYPGLMGQPQNSAQGGTGIFPFEFYLIFPEILIPYEPISRCLHIKTFLASRFVAFSERMNSTHNSSIRLLYNLFKKSTNSYM